MALEKHVDLRRQPVGERRAERTALRTGANLRRNERRRLFLRLESGETARAVAAARLAEELAHGQVPRLETRPLAQTLQLVKGEVNAGKAALESRDLQLGEGRHRAAPRAVPAARDRLGGLVRDERAPGHLGRPVVEDERKQRMVEVRRGGVNRVHRHRRGARRRVEAIDADPRRDAVRFADRAVAEGDACLLGPFEQPVSRNPRGHRSRNLRLDRQAARPGSFFVASR